MAVTTFARDLGPALSAEALKLRRTLALSLAFVAPVLLVGLEFCIFVDRGAEMTPEDGRIWQQLTLNSLMLYNLLVVPLFVTLQTALLGGLEHGNRNWKQLYALPVSRGALYAAKQLVAVGLIGLSAPVLVGAIVVAGLALRAIYPGIGFEAPVPAWEILRYALLSWVASWLIVAIHTWIGMRWSSFVVAMGVGVSATIAAVMIIQSEYVGYYPWTMPGVVVRQAMLDGVVPVRTLAAWVAGALVCAVAGGIEFTRRDVL